MNPFSTTKVKAETQKEEKNKYVSFIFVPGGKERAAFETMNHRPRFPKEKWRERKKKVFFSDLLAIHENQMFPCVYGLEWRGTRSSFH